MSLTKDQIISNIIEVEGGAKSYVFNKNDLGGETNFGITANKAAEYKSQLQKTFNWDGTMRNLTIPMAKYIYDVSFWQALKLDSIINIAPNLAAKLFDIGVNAGVGRAGLWLQQILNALNLQGKAYPDIAMDGSVGVGTIAAFNGLVKSRGAATTDRLTTTALICIQGSHYITISLQRGANETFTAGWLNRTADSIKDASGVF